MAADYTGRMDCTVNACQTPAISRGWCNKHYQRWYRYGDPLVERKIGRPLVGTTEERFMARVVSTDDCWQWDSPSTDGYGHFSSPESKTTSAHRWAYMLFVGPIPEGRDIDHLCHNRDENCNLRSACPHRSCVNPAHLEAVSHQVNVLRSGRNFGVTQRNRTHCKAGHLFDEANTYRWRGSRYCRRCRAAAVARCLANKVQL